MTTAFVIGNGTSRQDIDLNQLRPYGKIYGCNALYRDFIPDVLVATDKPIATAIIDSGYPDRYVFYTRLRHARDRARVIDERYNECSSGPAAVSIAAQAGAQRIYLIGFDMGPSDQGLINNIYAGTDFYKDKTHPPIFAGNWTKQLIKIARDFPRIQIVRLHGTNTAEINDFSAVPNIINEDLLTFLQSINTGRNP